VLVGTIVKRTPWPWFLIVAELPGGERVTSHVAATLRLQFTKLAVGDRVEVEHVVGGRMRVVRRLPAY
jgi:translation initiation factor IF-1